jgi:hypothetical protein
MLVREGNNSFFDLTNPMFDFFGLLQDEFVASKFVDFSVLERINNA